MMKKVHEYPRRSWPSPGSSRITFQIELWSWQLKSEIVESSWSDDGQFDRRALRKLLSLERLKDSS